MLEFLQLWDLTPGRERTEIHLPGSPQRCESRSAVEDETGQVWVLEKLLPGQFDRRERIGRTLSKLEAAGLPVPAYRPAPDGRYVAEQDGSYFQLSPFIPGDPLPQPGFVDEPERGESLGAFIAALHAAAPTIREFDDAPRFSLEGYVNELMATIAPRRPDVHEALLPVLAVLAPLFEAWDDLPRTLNQGDFHPLNVIWRDQTVGAVIDWEFCGLRPILFDTANCLGCVGIEDPPALVRGLAMQMLHSLRDHGCLEELSLETLPGLILGLRFAWMSEWLRRNDQEMIELEVRYMRLLTNSIDTLLPAWHTVLGKE